MLERKLVRELFEARRKIAAWRKEYNEERPHSSLGYRTSAGFVRAIGGETSGGKDGGLAALENASRFPLSHRSGGGDLSLSEEILHSKTQLGSEGTVV